MLLLLLRILFRKTALCSSLLLLIKILQPIQKSQKTIIMYIYAHILFFLHYIFLYNINKKVLWPKLHFPQGLIGQWIFFFIEFSKDVVKGEPLKGLHRVLDVPKQRFQPDIRDCFFLSCPICLSQLITNLESSIICNVLISLVEAISKRVRRAMSCNFLFVPLLRA